ncbi:wd repeat domain 61, partial [Nannochloropsis gaditana CCMP526]
GGSDGDIHVFDVETGHLLATLPGHTQAVRALRYTPGGYALLSGSDDRRVHVHEINAGSSRGRSPSLVSSYDGHASFVLSLAASGDGRHFASGGGDRRINLWD